MKMLSIVRVLAAAIPLFFPCAHAVELIETGMNGGFDQDGGEVSAMVDGADEVNRATASGGLAGTPTNNNTRLRGGHATTDARGVSLGYFYPYVYARANGGRGGPSSMSEAFLGGDGGNAVATAIGLNDVAIEFRVDSLARGGNAGASSLSGGTGGRGGDASASGYGQLGGTGQLTRVVQARSGDGGAGGQLGELTR